MTCLQAQEVKKTVSHVSIIHSIYRSLNASALVIALVLCGVRMARCDEKFHGDWKLDLEIDNGIPYDAITMARRKDWVWRFDVPSENGKCVYSILDNRSVVVSYNYEVSKVDGVFRFTARYNGDNPKYKAQFTDTVIRGIMKIEGDALIRCYWTEDGFPSAFDSSPGSRLIYQRLRRNSK